MLRPVIRLFYIAIIVAYVSACANYGKKDGAETFAGDKSGTSMYYNEAIEAAKKGDTDKAIMYLDKVILASPEFALAYTHLGLQYLKKNDLDAAEQAFNKSISLNSAEFVAYNHQGVIMRKRGDFANAKNMYLKAIKLNPDYSNAHLNIAVLYDIYLYDLDRALQHYKKYQSLTGGSDELVSKWLVDLERRISVKNRQN